MRCNVMQYYYGGKDSIGVKKEGGRKRRLLELPRTMTRQTDRQEDMYRT